jgi:hypothetical protein
MPFGQSKTFGFSNEIIPFLIISGTGNGIGVFVYNGTPEHGNPPIAWMTNGSLVDPYGNALPAVMGIAGVGEFSAGNAIITPNGLFLYSATELAFSFSTTSGNDPRYGQPFIPGLIAYNTSGGGGAILVPGAAPALGLQPPNVVTMSESPNVQGFADNAGLVNELVALALVSGQETTGSGNAAVQLFSETNDGTGPARGALIISGVQILGWGVGGVTVSTGNGAISGRPDFTQSDITIDTNANLTGSNPATMQWSIPADDAQVGTVYEIVSEFNLTTGTAAETIGFKPNLDGTSLATSGGDSIGATALAASTGYTGEVRLRVQVRTIGATGTVDIFIKGGMAIEGNLQGTVDSWNLSSQVTGVSFDTLNAHTIGINSIWGGNPVGSTQTISNRGSTFTRRGP